MDSGSALAVLGLAVVAAIAEHGRVRLDSNTPVSISVLPTVFAAAVFGPLAAMLVSSASLISDAPFGRFRARGSDDAPSGQPALRWGIYTCVRAIYGAAAGFAAFSIARRGHPDLTTQIIVATVTAALVAEVNDLALVVLTAYIRRNRALDFLRMCAPMYAVSVCLYTPIVAGASQSRIRRFLRGRSRSSSFPPSRLSGLFGLYQEQRRLTSELVGANADLERANISACDRTCHNPRREGPLHGGALCSGRDLRPRHCDSHGRS